jgi:hypothetical protein
MSSVPVKSKQDLREIARFQQFVLYGILANILAIMLIFTGPQILVTIFPGALRNSPPVILLSLQIFYLTVALAVLVAAILLGTKVYHPVVGAFLGMFTLVPCLGLLILLLMNQRATTMLQQRGIRVGLMGANMGDFDKLE